MSSEYRVVPFIGRIRSSQSASEVATQLEALINQEAKDGWEFEQVNNVNIEVQPGCLGGLLGSKSDYVRFDMIVFKRPT